ncbi:PREDICTED: regenerating islet-derived protein 4-like [Nanorana parkeri]|uniref:regenerating islet-derived protein 4-like n=1 Tax=Nanorana parkeri TaxID=125878 RepID=UPI000854E649|nr:PREDICTED: regenerating islet-derived protein 4-like [Nanorana parkeri]
MEPTRMKPSNYLTLLGYLVITVSVSEAVPRYSCPPGWFFYKAYCYGFFRFHLTWSEAEYECVSYGHDAHLASILDDLEASIIASHVAAYLSTADVWIGIHDPKQNRRWKWNDGSMYNYRAWQSGEPNNMHNSEYCGKLTTETQFLQWKDSQCQEESYFVCKYKR